MAPWAIGTDTGGSVRIPAAWNGVTGLKTTIGRISTYGVLPLSPTLDTPGPITRDVEDAALLLAVLQGADPRDPHTLGVHDVRPDAGAAARREGAAARRGCPAAERDGIDAEVLAAYDRSVDALAGLGAEIVDVALPGAVRRSRRDQRPDHVGRGVCGAGRIWSTTTRSRWTRRCGRACAPGAAISSRDYLAALAERERMKRGVQRRASRAWTRC